MKKNGQNQYEENCPWKNVSFFSRIAKKIKRKKVKKNKTEAKETEKESNIVKEQ